MARVHSARDPRLAGPASACVARDCTARRASAHRSGHRSPGTHRGAAGGGATMAEVEQRKVLEHPRRRGHPPGMWVEAIAHRSFLPTGKGGKTRLAVVFSDEVRAPVAGGGPASGWRGRGSSAQQSTEKKRQGGCSGLRSPWRSSRRRRRPDSGGGALEQRHDAWTVTWSALDTGDGAVGTGVREARRRRGSDSGEALSERCCRSVPLWHGTGAWQPRGDSAATGGSSVGNEG
jgi:hypothetical protein